MRFSGTNDTCFEYADRKRERLTLLLLTATAYDQNQGGAMSAIVDDPAAYFTQFVPERSTLLKELEQEAQRDAIPIVGPVDRKSVV